MKNPFKSLRLENLKENLSHISHRFPISISLLILLCAALFNSLHLELDTATAENMLKLEFSLVVTFFFSLGIYLVSEIYKQDNLKKNVFQIIPILFGIIFYLGFKKNLDGDDNIIYFILTLSGIISFLFLAPYLKQITIKEDFQKVYYSYFYKTGVVFLISIIFGGVLFGLGTIGITAVFELFDLRGVVSDDIYGDWAIIALSFITPIFAMTQLPKKESYDEEVFKENAFFSFLVKYIAIPFICVYFVILYAYSAKVLANFQDWPKGEVSWMVIGFSIFGYLIYMFSYIFEEKTSFIRFFRKWFPVAVIPQLFMLFYAIGIRIAQYDITMNRYFVVVFGIWLSFISVYLIISRIKHIIFIPLVLAIFTAIISVGPWGVYSLPESRQSMRLENNLVKAGILKNGQIIPLKKFEDIDKDLSREIYSGISYLCGYDNCERIKTLFSEQYKELEKKHKEESSRPEAMIKDSYVRDNEIRSWQIVDYITDDIKVRTYYPGEGDGKREYIYLSVDGPVFPIETSGYSKILKISSYYPLNKEKEYADINMKDKTMNIYENGELKEKIEISGVLDGLIEKYSEIQLENLSKSEMTFELQGTKGSYKIYLENITLKNPLHEGKNDENYYNVSGFVLIR